MKLIKLKKLPFIKFHAITIGSLVFVTEQHTGDPMLLARKEYYAYNNLHQQLPTHLGRD